MAVRFDLVAQSAFHIAQADGRPLFLSFQEGQAFIGGDPVEPGIELGVFPEVSQAVPYPDEYILQHVIGVVMVYYQAANMPVELLLVLPDNCGKSRFAGS